MDTTTYKEYVNNTSFNYPLIIGAIIVIGIILLILILVYKFLNLDLNDNIAKKVYEQVKEDSSFLAMSKKRYTVREYAKTEISDISLATIMEAGRIAPTSNNCQPQRIFILKSESSRSKLSICCETFNAPILLLICADVSVVSSNQNVKNSAKIDVAIVATQMMNEATSQGIGSAWITDYDENIIKREFELDKDIEPVCVMALGYALETVDKSDRYKTDRKVLNKTVKII